MAIVLILELERLPFFIYKKFERNDFKCILPTLLNSGDLKERCWPSVNTIAGDIKLSPATVRRAIRNLKKVGLIETEQRYREKGGKSSLLFKLIHKNYHNCNVVYPLSRTIFISE